MPLHRTKHFQHSSHTYEEMKVGVERNIDKKVFGTYRACTERTFKKYRIKNGNVEVRFKGKWYQCEENKPSWTNYQRKQTIKFAEETGTCYCAVDCWVRIWLED